MARVIVVTSGKGGVGKTSVTSNLGITLAKDSKVCLIDADLGLKNLDVVLGIENRVVFDMQDVISGVCSLAQALVKDKRNNNLYVLPACKSIDVQKINFSYLEKIRDKYQNELIDLNLLLNKALSEQRENIEIIKLLEVNNDPNFESFTPRPVNSFNKTKIIELNEEQKVLEVKIQELKDKVASVENEINEVNEVIKVAKECIF